MQVVSRIIKLEDGTHIYSEIIDTDKSMWLIFNHGIGEHLGRHRYLKNILGKKYNLLWYDLRGHGRSSGKRAYIDHFETFLFDLNQIIEYLQSEYKMIRYCLMGHSMGSLICAGFLKYLKEENLYPSKVFLSAPPVQVEGILGLIFRKYPFLLKPLLQLPISASIRGAVHLKRLSHDRKIYREYINDTFNCLGLDSKLIFELLNFSNMIFTRPLNAKCPLACAVGKEDSIVNTEKLEEYFRTQEKGTQLKIIEGGFHELHNELFNIKEEYFSFLKSFLMSE